MLLALCLAICSVWVAPFCAVVGCFSSLLQIWSSHETAAVEWFTMTISCSVALNHAQSFMLEWETSVTSMLFIVVADAATSWTYFIIFQGEVASQCHSHTQTQPTYVTCTMAKGPKLKLILKPTRSRAQGPRWCVRWCVRWSRWSNIMFCPGDLHGFRWI